MASHQKHQTRAVFLYLRNAEDLRLLAATFAGSPQLAIHTKEVDTSQVGRLISGTLRNRSESWLLVFDIGKPQYVLAIAVPIYGYSNHVFALDKPSASDEVNSFLEILGEGGWSPVQAFENLSRHLEEHPERPYSNSYALIHLETPIVDVEWLDLPDDFLSIPAPTASELTEPISADAFTTPSSGSETPLTLPVSLTTTVSQALQNANARIQTAREHQLASLLSGESTAERATTNIDSAIYAESRTLARLIQETAHVQPTLPPCLAEFDDILDEHTRQFLLTADTIHQLTGAITVPDFDYSAAGVGLWKAVERELNLSIVWHLRRCEHLAGPDPFVRLDPNAKVKYGGFDLNSSDQADKERFGGIELGKIKAMLSEAAPQVHIQGTLAEPWPDRLTSADAQAMPGLLNEVKDIRNRYSHIAAMSKPHYDRLRSKVLGHGADSLICEVLKLRRAILDYWRSSG